MFIIERLWTNSSKEKFPIGHSNTPKPAPPPDYTAATKPSPVQSELENQALTGLRWAAKGDYTNPHEGGLFVNYADPALRLRNAELQTNEAGQGIEGIGTPDPNYLATAGANRKAHMAEDAAGQYESDIKEGVGAARGVGLNLSNLSAEDRRAVLASQTGLYNTQLQKQQPAWWQQLLMGAAPAAAGAI